MWFLIVKLLIFLMQHVATKVMNTLIVVTPAVITADNFITATVFRGYLLLL